MQVKVLLITVALFLAGIGGTYQSYCSSLFISSDVDKVYVSPEHVIVSLEGIFVLIGEERMQIQAIMQDDNGIYYLRPKFCWTCKKCGYSENPPWTNYCEKCRSRYDE